MLSSAALARGTRHEAFFIFPALLVAVISAGQPAYADDPARLWRVCAQSEVIVSGTISVPLDKSGQIVAESNGYVPVFVVVDRTFKGEERHSITVWHYSRSKSTEIQDTALIRLDGKKAILFLLSTTDDGVTRKFYFAGYQDGLEDVTPEGLNSVAAEVARQRAVLQNWTPSRPNREAAIVKALIERMTKRDSETAAFKALEAQGKPAVPAIIDLVDDRRDLPIKQIGLRNPPGFFEGIRWYGPEKVVDALAAILSQITREGFGFVYNGATDDERARTVAGWRIYKDVLLNHPEWLKERNDVTH